MNIHLLRLRQNSSAKDPIGRRITMLSLLATLLAAALIGWPAFTQAQDASATPGQASASGSPSQAEMMAKMMELAKLNENHKLLADMAGHWTYTIKMWMNPDPSAPPSESSGSMVTKSLMGGRFFVSDVTGKMQMPGADGKMKTMEFKGMGVDGYDNVKQKFVASWVDNMGTGIMNSEGTYDPGTKTFTYNSEYEAMPGMKTKIREVVKIVDKDHHVFEWYEDRAGQEAKTMEISYTRKK